MMESNEPDTYGFTKEELILLYEYLKNEYISYDNEELRAVVDKIYAYIKTD